MSSQIFRKVSLERLSSPEQLDTLMTVTSPRGWVAMIAMAILVATAVVWGFFGSMATKINCQGVLIKSGGVQNIVSGANGQVTDIRVVMDDFVRRGEVVARLERPDLLNPLLEAKERLRVAEPEGTQGQAEALRREVRRLQAELETGSQVVSPFDGRVVEIKISKGDLINAGLPIISLELSGEQIKDLEAVLYVRAEDGKQVRPGMAVQMAPSPVKKEQFGLMLGRVTSVSEYPTTPQGMMKTLGNEELVKLLSGSGAHVEVHVDLVPDKASPTGYKWTSSEGPPLKLNSGTLTEGYIIVKKQRPIAQVIPQLE